MDLHRYNLMYASDPSASGLYVLTTPAYIDLITKNPGFVHENEGDFYSEILPRDLAPLVSDILSEGEKLKMVSAGSFLQEECSPLENYLVRFDQGVRLYFPVFHLKEKQTGMLYGFLGLSFIEELFSDEKKGTAQKNFESAVSMLREAAELLGKVRLEAEGLAGRIDTLTRDLRNS